jgi:hypothetical protein
MLVVYRWVTGKPITKIPLQKLILYRLLTRLAFNQPLLVIAANQFLFNAIENLFDLG